MAREVVAGALAALLFCTSCAIGHIHRLDGTTITGVVVGAAAIETCDGDGRIDAETESAMGAMVGRCSRLDGGTLSSTFATMIGALASAAALYFGGGF